MAEITQAQFLQRYGNLMVQIWGMPSLLDRFKKEPTAVLKEHGLDTGKASVTLLQPGTPNALGINDSTAESAYQLWVEGQKKGNIPFYFVSQPPEGTGSESLSDSELMAVAGGALSISSCCCTPCCC
ncbi:MAG TPA: hypothetical protein VGK48_05545 [Terriglobia bacterium]|jgi:hypothetical protein